MTLGELLREANEHDYIDLQALIMFLVFEKKVLTLDDDTKELDLYFLKKHNERMNRELHAYKQKMKMQYKPYVFEIKVKPKEYSTLYILAQTRVQAESFCRSLLYEPIDTSVCDNELLMTKYNQKNEEINVKIKDLKNNKIPSLLGGF